MNDSSTKDSSTNWNFNLHVSAIPLVTIVLTTLVLPIGKLHLLNAVLRRSL